MSLFNRGSDPSYEGFLQQFPDIRGYYRNNMKELDGPYDYEGSSSASHFSETPVLSSDVFDMHHFVITFFAVYYSSNITSFISSLSDHVHMCDFVVHSGTDSKIVAVAFFSQIPSHELARRVCSHERVPSNQITVLNSVDFHSLFRIRDYVKCVIGTRRDI